jgi:hypothetical protein
MIKPKLISLPNNTTPHQEAQKNLVVARDVAANPSTILLIANFFF